MEIPEQPKVYTALIVDDNFYNRHIFRIALEAVNYEVHEVEDGLKGTSLLEKQTFNLLILDLQLPGMDGRSVLKAVRSQDLHKNMRIVVVTANAHMAADNDIDTLADYTMFKPINVMEFSGFAKRLQSMHQASTSS